MPGLTAEDEILRISAPLWSLISRWDKNNRNFDIIQCAAMNIVAHLAYCAIDEQERRRTARAKVIPSRAYQMVLAADVVDVPEILRIRADFQGVQSFRTRSFVAIAMPVNEMVFVGVRGTQDAYDWLINLQVAKSTTKEFFGQKVHAGFYAEARKLFGALENFLQTLPPQYWSRVYYTGHSLGAALASLLQYFWIVNSIGFKSPNSCYLFASPRTFDRLALPLRYTSMFSVRRHLDIVPHCPPKFLHYGDFPDQRLPNGTQYSGGRSGDLLSYSKWIASLALNRFVEQHSIESYRRDVFASVRTDPRIEQNWRFEFSTE